MIRNLGKRPAQARSNAVWGSGKIAGGVAVIAAAAALIGPGVANAYVFPAHTSPVMLPAPIAPVTAPVATTDSTSTATVSWGDVSWGDALL